MPVSPLSPVPQFPETGGYQYEVKQAPNAPGQRGPLRFEEGVATDTDIPNDFVVGAQQGYQSMPGRINRNVKVDTKYAEETTQQRAHVGSAAWVEAPTFLGEFAHGSFNDYAEVEFEQEIRSGRRYSRVNPASVQD